jgi:outer membrane protein assembly factor BamA
MHFSQRLLVPMKIFRLLCASLFCFAAIGHAKILDTLVIEGLSIHQNSVVRNSMTLREKSEFSPADIQLAVKSLYKTGFFKTVDFFVTKETDSAATLLLKLTEYQRQQKTQGQGF